MSTEFSASLGPCSTALRDHHALAKRRQESRKRLEQVRDAFAQRAVITRHPLAVIKRHPLAIFCAGSLARMEAGARSDLDLFVTAGKVDDLRKRLFQIELFSELMVINEQLDFPPFSNDGEYLKVCFMEDLKSGTGSRLDDSENLFTTRMLLILESQWVVNENLHVRHLHEILGFYCRDSVETGSFRPVFLLNDLLRYWRTMCLNYEERRHDVDQPFRKKNVNLKFSRMLTVFGTVLPLIAKPADSAADLEALCARPPLERLASGLDLLNDSQLTKRWHGVLDMYAEFLSWKEAADVEDFLTRQKDVVNERAKELSSFLYDALTHERVPGDFRRYLIL